MTFFSHELLWMENELLWMEKMLSTKINSFFTFHIYTFSCFSYWFIFKKFFGEGGQTQWRKLYVRIPPWMTPCIRHSFNLSRFLYTLLNWRIIGFRVYTLPIPPWLTRGPFLPTQGQATPLCISNQSHFKKLYAYRVRRYEEHSDKSHKSLCAHVICLTRTYTVHNLLLGT